MTLAFKNFLLSAFALFFFSVSSLAFANPSDASFVTPDKSNLTSEEQALLARPDSENLKLLDGRQMVISRTGLGKIFNPHAANAAKYRVLDFPDTPTVLGLFRAAVVTPTSVLWGFSIDLKTNKLHKVVFLDKEAYGFAPDDTLNVSAAAQSNVNAYFEQHGPVLSRYLDYRSIGSSMGGVLKWKNSVASYPFKNCQSCHRKNQVTPAW